MAKKASEKKTKETTSKAKTKTAKEKNLEEISTGLDDIIAPVKGTKKAKKSSKSSLPEEIKTCNDESTEKKLDDAYKNINEDQVDEDLDDILPDDEAAAKELDSEVEKLKDANKGKKAKGKKMTVADMASTNREMLTMDDVKAHFIEVGKKNNNVVKQEDIEKYTSHLKLSDDDFNDLIVSLQDNGITLDSGEEIDDDNLPPMFDEDNFSEDKEPEFDEEEEEMLSNIDTKNSDPVRQYLHAIGAYQVFKNKNEEVICAQQILSGEEALKQLEPYLEEAFGIYRKDHPTSDFRTFVDQELPSTDENLEDEFDQILINRYPCIKPDSEIYSLKERVDAGKDSKNRLIQCNLKLVVSIAKHYVNRGMDFLDLIQEGNLGLMKAVDKFDYTRGFKFSTYATWWIRQAITRALADQARTIRIPVHMVETINKITRAQRKLVQKLNRDPTAEEISEELGGQWSASRIREIQQIALDPLSLEKPVGEEEDSHVGDFIEDKDNVSPFDFANESMKKERIDEVLNQLTDREARVIRLRYGLEDGRTHTLEEVGKEFNVTRERIRQIEAKALKKLRHPARAKLLKDFR